jgi:peptidoglycan/xylan/chitin deacetylase (PgdA/CDA1 family)
MAEAGSEGRWPAGTHCTAVVTVNFDVETLLLSEDPSFADRQKSLSIMRYGANRGAQRLLEVFDELEVPTTWFVPGRVAETYPGIVRDVAQEGHSIGMRGYALERYDSLDQPASAEALRRGRDTVSDLLGSPVRGFRLPSGEWPITLADQLLDCGISWSSSWFGEDLPFHLPGSGKRRLLEIPASYTLDDRIAFFWNFSPPMPPGQSRISPYSEVLRNWIYELEGCQREGLCFVIRCIGDLRQLGAYPSGRCIRSSSDTMFATCDQVSDRWQSRHPPMTPSSRRGLLQGASAIGDHHPRLELRRLTA